MSATLRAATTRAYEAGDAPAVAAVLKALARGALYGACGNSGVILSQALRGFANGVGETESFDAAALARGLNGAASAAYAAVSQPKEGTMLTVMRMTAQAADAAVAEMEGAGSFQPCASLLAVAVAAAEKAEAETMDQLPALKEAGVPDAGGEGVCVILRGLHAALLGTIPPAPADLPRPLAAAVDHAHDNFGSCTEFLIEAVAGELDLEQLRAVVTSGGNQSIVVVGDSLLARVHVHSQQPEALLAIAGELGRVSRVKVEDMTAQNRRFGASGSGAGARVAVLAMSRGTGFDAIFESLGAAVSEIGVIGKPAAGQIAEAANALGIPDVIVLPNHENVVLAATQAVTLARCTLHIVPTRSLPQGIAATLAFDADEAPAANVPTMSAAAAAVQTIEVTNSASDRVAEGISVRAGQPIALLDGRLVAAADGPIDALVQALRARETAPGFAGAAGLITVYGGEGVGAAELESVRATVSAEAPGAEVEAHIGGQPLYRFIVSVES
jgi:uncharacterized protein